MQHDAIVNKKMAFLDTIFFCMLSNFEISRISRSYQCGVVAVSGSNGRKECARGGDFRAVPLL